jgi:hypothetical protein
MHLVGISSFAQPDRELVETYLQEAQHTGSSWLVVCFFRQTCAAALQGHV